MRSLVAFVAAALVSSVGSGLVQAQSAAPPAAKGQKGSPSITNACADKPDALGTSRVVEIDTTGGPGFGFEHFRHHDFLRRNEVVLTFDDGPWVTTPAVLEALAQHCVRATFFPIGKHATYYPEILREVIKGGHTVGTHTWSHKNLARAKFEDGKTEIEMGISAVLLSAGVPTAPFFRFPVLQHPPKLTEYLAERNIGIFSTDMDSFDFKMRRPEQVIEAVMRKVDKLGKGIVLLHDFQRHTSEALPELLKRLKAGGYKIVHMTAKNKLTSLPEFDEMVRAAAKLPSADARPTSSVVRTIEGN